MAKGKRFNTSDPTANNAVGNTCNADADDLRRRNRIREQADADRNERIRRAREQAAPDDDPAA